MIIKSYRELSNKYNAIARLAHERQEPIYISRNGEIDLAIMSVEAFECIIKIILKIPDSILS